MSVSSEFKRKVNIGYNYKGDTNLFEWIVFALMILAVIYVLFILYRIMTIAAFVVTIAMAAITIKIIKKDRKIKCKKIVQSKKQCKSKITY